MRLQPIRIKQWLTTAVAIGLIHSLSSCGPTGDNDDPGITPVPPGSEVTPPATVTASGSLTDIINQTGHLSLLKTAMTRAGLSDKFKTGALTLFAPTDDAFRAAGYTSTASLDTLPPAQLQRLLQYHVLDTRLSVSTLPTGTAVNTPTALVTTSVSLFRTTDNKLFANASRVVQPDIGANTSVMYVIDKVLTIPSQTTIDLIRSNPNLTLFRAAVERAGTTVSALLLSPTDRGITVFAPSNAAFQAAGYTTEDVVRSADVTRLTDILRYHIVSSRSFSPMLRSGDVTTVQGTPFTVTVGAQTTTITGKGNPTATGKLLQTDLITTNGVVHVIDRVLLPTGVTQ